MVDLVIDEEDLPIKQVITIAHTWGHFPRNPNQRVDNRATRPATLERANETHAFHGLYLHPTRGWKRLSTKRGRAEHIVAAVKSGRTASMAEMKRFIQRGY